MDHAEIRLLHRTEDDRLRQERSVTLPDAMISRFNTEALEWDKSPAHQETARLTLSALQRFGLIGTDVISDNDAGLDVLEIGCGTGLLSFSLQPLVRSIIGIDAAQGMIDVFQMKKERLQSISQASISRIDCLCQMFTDADDEALQSIGQSRRFGLVVSLLLMHHVPEHTEILKAMFNALHDGGHIALFDYEDFGEEAIWFHPKSKWDTVDHHGLKRDDMQRSLEEAGFVQVRVETAFTLSKEVEKESGIKQKMEFPFLICTGLKSKADGEDDRVVV